MPDHEASFLKLWAILESLTGTMREGYKITIRRTAFIFREPDYHLEVLKMLMEFRNQVVHVGTEDRNAEVYLFQLKGYVETILGFHIWKLVRFESLSEATEFLDMSRNMKNIDSKIKLLNKARKFLKS